MSSGAGDSAAPGARPCARAPASVSVCVSVRARAHGEGGKRPRDARRDRGKILLPRESVSRGRRLERASRRGEELPARRRRGGGGLPRRARRFRIRAAPNRAGRAATDAAEAAPTAHGSAARSWEEPGRSLPPPPPSGLLSRARRTGIETPTAATSTVEAPRTEPGNPGARGRLPAAAGVRKGCRRAVGGGPRAARPAASAGWRKPGGGVGVRSVQGAVDRQSRGLWGASAPGGTLPVFPFGGHFSTKLSTAQVKVLGSSLFGASSLCKASEHCAALKSGFSKNQPAWRLLNLLNRYSLTHPGYTLYHRNKMFQHIHMSFLPKDLSS